MSTHSICFYGELIKIILHISSNTHLICSTAVVLNGQPRSLIFMKLTVRTKLCRCAGRSELLMHAHLSHLITKPTMWLCAQRRRISLGIRPVWSESSLSAWRKLVSLTTHWAHSKDSDPLSGQRRLWSDWADAQADLSLLWAHMPCCWFYQEAAHFLISFVVTSSYSCTWP